MSYVLDLPDLPTWNANSRGHWSQRASEVAAWRLVAKQAANAAGIPPLDVVFVELTMIPADRRRRDPDNLAGALKPVLDGLVDAGVIPDDSWQHVAGVALAIENPDPSLNSHRWRLMIDVLEHDCRDSIDGGVCAQCGKEAA